MNEAYLLQYVDRHEQRIRDLENHISSIWNEMKMLNKRIEKLESERSAKDLDYGDVVKAITSSNLSSYYKQRLIDIVRKDEDSAYYKAVIAVVESDMSDYVITITVKTL